MIEQRTEEWLEERRGKITGSQVYLLVNTKKPNDPFSKTARDYMNQLIAERLGDPIVEFNTPELEYGREQEEYARRAYENTTASIVFESGFITHPDYSFLGGSPDGLIKQNNDIVQPFSKGIEIKCPARGKNHIRHMRGELPKEYEYQIQFYMLLTGLEQWDFVSFYPNIKNQLFINTIKADKKLHSHLLERCLRFEEEMQNALVKIESFNPAALKAA